LLYDVDRMSEPTTKPMRLCLFTPNFLPSIGGAEKDADLVAEGLSRRGHQVVVLAPRVPGTMPERPYAVERYRKPPRQHLWPEVLGWPLRRCVRRHGIQVVLAFYSYPTGYVAARLKRRLNVGVVLCPQGGDLYPNYHGLRKPRVASVIRAGYQRADRIVSISHWLTDRLHTVVGAGLPPVEVVYNGIDLQEHDRLAQEARSITPPIDRPFVLHLARVAPVKRHDLAVQGVARLQQRFRERGWCYAIVGDGESAAAIRRQIETLGVQDIVPMLGTRTGLERAWLYHHARFMVSTSREEGLGNVTLEAMASGLPMLASDIGPHRELIPTADSRSWGRLFTSEDPDAFTAALEHMLDEDLPTMSRRALELRDRYTLERMIDGYEAVCAQALQDVGSRKV
jgi:glycosyltransferase involved in cell wall biosynthesis